MRIKRRILLINDREDEIILRMFLIKKWISESKNDKPYLISLFKALNSNEAFNTLISNGFEFDLIITDLERGDDDPIKFIQFCKEFFPDIKVLVLSYHSEKNLLELGQDADFALSAAESYETTVAVLDHLLFNRPLNI
ncbi:MAG: hypothetical protein AB7W47_07655 [Calditrichaceae bacterium]